MGQVSRVSKSCRGTRPSAVGIGIAVRVGFGPAQHLVDTVDEAIRDDVLQLLGLVVDLVPAESHHPDQEQLDQAMAAEDQRGQLLAGGREPDAVVRLVLDQPRLRERLDHRRRGARRDAERRGELAHGQQALPGRQLPLAEVDRLQVVLDGAGRKHRRIISLPDFLCNPAFDISRDSCALILSSQNSR